MLREYIISEAMAALGVPTTSSLAVVTTGDRVLRESPLPGAVLTRVAASHLRVGSFELAAALRERPPLRALLDYAIERLHPELADVSRPALGLWDAVARRQAALIAPWMRVGMVRDKLGLPGQQEDDTALATALLELMEEASADYTNTFRALSGVVPIPPALEVAGGWDGWRSRWDARCDRSRGEGPAPETRERMQRANPAVVPRNHRVEEALDGAVRSADLEPLHRLVAALRSPARHRVRASIESTRTPRRP